MNSAREHEIPQNESADGASNAASLPAIPLMASSFPAICAIDTLERAGHTGFRILKSCLRSQGMDRMTVRELLSLHGARFESLPGVGRTKRVALEKLQHTLRVTGFAATDPAPDTCCATPVAGRMHVVPLSHEERRVPVGQLAWSRTEKQNRRFRRLLQVSPKMTVDDVLNADCCPNWFAPRVKDLFPQWQERHHLLSNAMAAPTPRDQLRGLSELVERDVISVLCNCAARDSRIARARWGWDCDPEILEELATEFGVTRERIRQIQRGVEQELRAYTLVDSQRVRKLLGSFCVPSLPSAVPALAAHIGITASLASLFEAVYGCVFDDDELRDYYRNQLIPVFCTTNPVDRQMFHGLLHARTGDLSRALDDVVKLQALGLIELREDGLVSPRLLTQADAVAHVLSDRAHAEGVHWTVLIQTVNEGRFCEQPIGQERQGSFLHGPHAALCGVGHYAHIQYLSSTSVPDAGKLRLLSAVHGLAIDTDRPLPLREALESLQEDETLQRDMACLATDGSDDAYYALRLLVKTDGYRVGGMQLDGASGRDVITLAAGPGAYQLLGQRRHSLGKTCGTSETKRRGLAA
jgi:hypothetical protein